MVFGILLYVVPRLKTPGLAVLSYIGLYSLGRFFLSYFRVNNIIVLGLREAQIVALVVLVLVIPAGYLLRRHAAKQANGVEPAEVPKK